MTINGSLLQSIGIVKAFSSRFWSKMWLGYVQDL